jgi:hypothetical protein
MAGGGVGVKALACALEQDAKKWEPVFRIDPALTL